MTTPDLLPLASRAEPSIAPARVNSAYPGVVYEDFRERMRNSPACMYRSPAQAKSSVVTGYGDLIAAAGLRVPQAPDVTGIPAPVQAKLESALGANFSGVRVHPKSAWAAEHRALAFTRGNDIYVAPGRWTPETVEGQELLGHELGHVLQQRAGRVQVTAQIGGEGANDEASLEAEADALGMRARTWPVRAEPSTLLSPTAALRTPGAGVLQLQRNEAAAERESSEPPRSVAEAFGYVQTSKSAQGSRHGDQRSAALLRALGAWLERVGSPENIERHVAQLDWKSIALTHPREVAALQIGEVRRWAEAARFKLEHGQSPRGIWTALEQAMASARFYLEQMADEGVSFELQEAPKYDHALIAQFPEATGANKAELRLFAFLRAHQAEIAAAEQRHGVDRRAIAGAIGWEGVVQVKTFSLRAVGLGKMHLGKDTLAVQVEEEGLLPKRDNATREALMRTASGAIEYIASSMEGAVRIVREEAGQDIRKNPGLLCWFYQSQDLRTFRAVVKRHVEKQAATWDVRQEPMPVWVLAHLAFLELAVGKTGVQ